VPQTPPVALSIPALRVDRAPVIPVSVDDQGFLDVPDPKVVGWYRHSPSPGYAGASVLASHVNWNRVPGVFRYLAKVEVGDEVVVGYADGTERRFAVIELTMYDKDELPAERVWTKSGDPTLVLMTCGGRYDADARSYEDNVVAYAVPVPVPVPAAPA
jgi:LPXTG-site transpeptidase (sortase) family protein